MPATRTVEQIDRDLHTQHEVRRSLQLQIDSLTTRLGALRNDYAKAGRRTEELLDERVAVTHHCPDTPADLDPGDRT